MEKQDFLSEAAFEEIRGFVPTDSWVTAQVFNPQKWLSKVNDTVRRSEKHYEKRQPVVKSLKKVILPRLIQWMKGEIKGYQYCWFRPNHVEWMRYHEGDFFRPHKDFERYTCNGMTPFVFILGLEDVEEGGETRVEDLLLSSSARKNGAILFQSNLQHESVTVKKGVKLCLKIELFVFRSEAEFYRVRGLNSQWLSFWQKSELKLVENYIERCRDFHRQGSDIVVEESSSKDIHNLSLLIADPKTPLPVDVDFYFPGHDKQSLHEIFSFDHSIRSGERIFYGQDEKAWEYLNTEYVLPVNMQLCVCLWIKEPKSNKDYKMESVYSRDGRCARVDRWWNTFSVEASERYSSLVDIRKKLLFNFMARFDSHQSTARDSDPLKSQPARKPLYKTKIDYRFPTPSDLKHKPLRKSGVETVTEQEWCNDEESGYDTYTYESYRQYDLQIRYVAWSTLDAVDDTKMLISC